jgi:hypothetical protein
MYFHCRFCYFNFEANILMGFGLLFKDHFFFTRVLLHGFLLFKFDVGSELVASIGSFSLGY